MCDTVKRKKHKHSVTSAETTTAGNETEAPSLPKKKKKKRVTSDINDGTQVHLNSPLSQPYTDASAFISSLGNRHVAGSGGQADAATVLDNFDTTHIQNALDALQQATKPALRGTPLAIPMPGSNSAQPQQIQRRATAEPARSWESASRSSSVQSSRPKTRNILPNALPDITLEYHPSILSEKWLSTSQLRDLAKSEGLKYKQGKFSRIEDAHLQLAVEDYRKKHHLQEHDIDEIVYAEDREKTGKEKRMEFWSLVTSAVEQRPIVSVYHHLKRIRDPLRQGEGGTGAWTTEQDQKLTQAIRMHGEKWKQIAPMVMRAAADCRDRYRNHLREIEQGRVHGKWSRAEEDQLMEIVQDMKVTLGLEEGDEIFWGRVSERMGGRRGKQQCRNKWQDQLQRRVLAENGNPRKWAACDYYILVSKMDKLHVEDDSEVDWSSLRGQDFTFSAHVIQKQWRQLVSTVDGFEDMTHPEIMNALRSKILSKPMPRKRGASMLPTSAEFVEDENSEHEATPTSPNAHQDQDQDIRQRSQSSDHRNVAGSQLGTDSVQDAEEGQLQQRKNKKKKRDFEHIEEPAEPLQKKKKRRQAAEDVSCEPVGATPSQALGLERTKKAKKKKKNLPLADAVADPIPSSVEEHGERVAKKKKKRRDRPAEEGA